MLAKRHRQGQQRLRPSSCSLPGQHQPRLADDAPVWEPEAVTALLLAHQGGWDEMLFVAVPILIFGGLLAVANRRASRIEKQRPQTGDAPPRDDPR
jgi:hypothetical protein